MSDCATFLSTELRSHLPLLACESLVLFLYIGLFLKTFIVLERSNVPLEKVIMEGNISSIRDP